ncbi:Alpha-L-fucosidase [Handroanthus impetiginosus]|uniref:Alpha-L-fucosidase n=1 Tax=Handroanthus impetiginosus TaxID=429701 RepID=A0A2G9GZM0_9LAMI|nr:Alpha-L-fucosidase [Handroanthus impetiginosus]
MGFSRPLLTIVLAICLPFVVCGCNKNRPVIFNFGDSNSDTGGFTAGFGFDAGYPYGRTFFQPPTGRQTDGRLVVDFLCEYLDTHYLSPYLDSLEPDFTNGANFAIGGACTLPRHVPFNLNIQILQFKRFYNHLVELSSKGMRNWVGEEDFKKALYTIDIGQNDLTGSFGQLSYAQTIDRIPSFISEIRDAILAIYQHGGRNFWVHNTGPLGCLPRELALRKNNIKGRDLDEYGCLKSLNKGAKIFNTKLKALCEELRSKLENSTIVYVDIYSIKYDLIANSKSYGFKNPLMACCGYGGAPYNYDLERTCLDGGYEEVCDKGTPYISWDGTHYTEAANAIVASKLLSNHYSCPPLEFKYFFCDKARVP